MRQRRSFRLDDLQKVPGNDERQAELQAQREREPPLRIGDVVTRTDGGQKMLVVDFIDTFDSPGIERGPDGKWRFLPDEASQLITVAWPCKRRGIVEDEVYRECLMRAPVCD